METENNESTSLFPVSWEDEEDQLRMAIMMSLQKATDDFEVEAQKEDTEATTSRFQPSNYTTNTTTLVRNKSLIRRIMGH